MIRREKKTITNAIVLLMVIIFAVITITDTTGKAVVLFSYNSTMLPNFVTIFTAPFIHSSALDLLFDGYILFLVGNTLEYHLGKKTYSIFLIFVIALSGILITLFTPTLFYGTNGIIYATIVTSVILSRRGYFTIFIGNSKIFLVIILVGLIMSALTYPVMFISYLSGIIAGIAAAIVIITVKEGT